MSLNKIGITGCTGVLGKLLNEILSKKNVNFSCFKGDIKKIQDVNRWISNNQDLEKIFHFAALVPIYKVENDKMNALRTNLNGTKNLINSIKKNKLKVWFFFPSSCHVYKSKKTKIKEICAELALSLNQVAHIGDDLNDIPVLNIVGLPITVADGIEDVIAIANFVTEKKGGEGAVREVCDLIIAAKDA